MLILLALWCILYSYASDEIHFNLMAIVSDRRKLYEKQIAEAEHRRELAAAKVCATYIIVTVFDL